MSRNDASIQNNEQPIYNNKTGNTSERLNRLETGYKLILDKLQLENQTNNIRFQLHEKKNISERIDRLETENKLILDKVQLDSQTADIRFQLVQKALDDLQGKKKKNGSNNNLWPAITEDSANLEINFIKQDIAGKYNEFKLILERFARNMKRKDQQIENLTEELEGVKKSILSQRPPTESEDEKFRSLLKERDEKLVQQIKANDTLLHSFKEELNSLRNSIQGQQHRALEFEDSDDDRETFGGDRETFKDDDDGEESSDISDIVFNEQDLEHLYLPNDTYSYFAVAKYVTGWSMTPAFTLAFFALMIQLVTLSIFVMDVFNIGNAGNLISVPPAVGVQVRASQLVALLISCWNQDEVRASFNVLSLGYHPEKVFAISRHANPTKWYLSIFIRILLGCYSLTVTFILIVKSETVRDVMLDFAAVTFVSELDNGAFLLSLWGYMGKDVQKLTMRMKNLPVCEPSSNKSKSSKSKKIPRLVWLSILIGIIVGFWIWITIKQERGLYMDQNIFVQFGDDFSPEIGAFSGLYRITLDQSPDGIRVNYVDLERERARFSYCSTDGMWIFQYGENPIDYSDSDCKSQAKSSETEELDITKAATVTWYVVEEDVALDMPLQHFYVSGRQQYYGQDCGSNDYCGERMKCGEVKDAKVCVCNDGMFGLNCEFPEPCRSLDIDPRNPNGFFGTRSWSRRYSSLREDGKETPFHVYGKPIYFGDESIEEELLVVDVMFFTGRRWILTDSSHIDDYKPSADRSASDLAEFLADNFHAYFSNYSFYFASEPVDVGTPKYSATPVGLQWFRLETSGTQGVSLRSGEKLWLGTMNIEASLFCAVCNNETNPCFYGSTCSSDGTCDCTTGASGRLCQIPPDGNGLCDAFFNTPEFGFDGGDCCEETCISTEDYICGNGMIENSAGVSAYGFVGFPNCQDPRFSAKLSGSTTLYQIIERGTLQCGGEVYPGFLVADDGYDSGYSGFEADLCKAIAAAALGDPEAVEFVHTTGGDRFSDLADGKFDVLIRRTTHTAERDIYQSGSKVGFSFAPIPALYDGLRYGGIPPYSGCADNLDYESTECRGLKICVAQDYSWFGVTQSLFPDSIVVGVQSDQAEVDGLEAGVCNVIAGEITFVAEFSVRERGFTGPVYELGENVYSKEPLSAVTRQDDRVWSKFVSWVFEALIQAEELSVTKSSADNLAPTDVFGEEFRNMFQNAVAANGNYGEIYEKNLEDKIPRSGLNNINWGDSGLIYAFPFGAIETRGRDPIVGGTIEVIRKRGTLNCGISKTPGFGAFDSETGIWSGFEVDMCRGISAALFSGSPNVNFIPLTTSERFTALADGTVDLMACTTTHTLIREIKEINTGEGFDFTPAIFYDGMGFGGRPPFVLCAEILSFDTFAVSPECPDTRICVPGGSTWLDALLGPLNVPQINIYITSSHTETYERFVSGDCNVIAGESARIAEATVREHGFPVGEDYFVAAKKYTREPLAIVSRSDDAQFSDLLRWMIFGFFFAAEQGITRSEYFNMPATNFLFGEALSGIWQHAIAAVGNYDEMFERNFAGLWERGGPNNLNDKSGPQFSAKPGVALN